MFQYSSWSDAKIEIHFNTTHPNIETALIMHELYTEFLYILHINLISFAT